MKGWVGLVGSGRFTHIVVTRQLQAERRTGSVRRPKTGVLPTVLRNQPRVNLQGCRCKIRGWGRYIQVCAPDNGRVPFPSIITNLSPWFGVGVGTWVFIARVKVAFLNKQRDDMRWTVRLMLVFLHRVEEKTVKYSTLFYEAFKHYSRADRCDDDAAGGVGDDVAWNQFSSDAVVSASVSSATARWVLKEPR